jgi:hypothetical protein
MVNAAIGRAPDAPLAEYPRHALAPERLRRFAGTYQGQPGTTVTVAERDGVLYVTAAEQEQAARPYADDSFLVPATEETYRFLEDESGSVWAAFSGMRTLRRA